MTSEDIGVWVVRIVGGYLLVSSLAPLMLIIPLFYAAATAPLNLVYLYAFPLDFYLDAWLDSLNYWVGLALGFVAYSVIFFAGQRAARL